MNSGTSTSFIWNRLPGSWSKRLLQRPVARASGDLPDFVVEAETEIFAEGALRVDLGNARHVDDRFSLRRIESHAREIEQQVRPAGIVLRRRLADDLPHLDGKLGDARGKLGLAAEVGEDLGARDGGELLREPREDLFSRDLVGPHGARAAAELHAG